MGNRVDIEQRTDQDFALGFALTDPTTGDPVPVTGWTGTLKVWDFNNVLIASAALVIDDANGGKFHMTIPQATLATLPTEFLKYAAQAIQADTTVQDLQWGILYVGTVP